MAAHGRVTRKQRPCGVDVVGRVMKCVEMGVEGVGWEVCLLVSEGWLRCWHGFCEV